MSVAGQERAPLVEYQQQKSREQGDWNDGDLSDLPVYKPGEWYPRNRSLERFINPL